MESVIRSERRRRMMEAAGGAKAVMQMPEERPVHPRPGIARDLTGLIVSWSVWLAMTAGLFLYVRQYSRNIPYMDEFAMVTVMTGAEPFSLRWAWAQHNEHRPMISRLIQAGLMRFVANDFRMARYANAGLLSAMAASMLLLARRLRGSARVTDAVLPLSILNVAQAESLMNGFAMNLVLTSVIAVALIAAAGLARRGDGTVAALGFGVSLILLPLSGGSGLVMLPPLALWLAGYLAWGWWSGRKPGATTRAIGLGLLLAGSGITALYLRGYLRPPHHPLPPSLAAVASSTLMYLTLAIYPNVTTYWWPAGPIIIAVVAATLVLLTIVSLRTPGERPRALALLAIILSMLGVSGAVGVSRAAFGPAAILASRYITLTTPLLCALYFAWLVYGKAPGRMGIHVGLLALMCLTLPDSHRYGRRYGWSVRVAEQRVERSLTHHVPTPELLTRACPAIYPEPGTARACFQMLKAARIGAFAEFEEDRVASTREAAGTIRR
jgi:hypothetical protein